MSRSLLHDWECAIERLCPEHTEEMLKIAEDIYNTAFVHGRNQAEWDKPTGKPIIRTSGDMSNYYICSECHKPIDGWDLFCKHCGADMRIKSS